MSGEPGHHPLDKYDDTDMTENEFDRLTLGFRRDEMAATVDRVTVRTVSAAADSPPTG